MQTDLILRRTQKGQLLVAMMIALVLPLMWHYLFQDLTIVIILTLTSMILMLAIGLLSKNPTTNKAKAAAHDNMHMIEEDLSNPADLWIWPVEPIPVTHQNVDLSKFDLDNPDEMMAWLEALARQEEQAQGKKVNEGRRIQTQHARQRSRPPTKSHRVDWILFFILISMIGVLIFLWLWGNG